MATTYLEDEITHQNVTTGYARVKLTHADLTAAATTETITFATLIAAHGGRNVPANAFVTNCWLNLKTVFAGGSVSACVIDVGDAGTADELVSAISVFTGAALGIKPRDGAYTFPTWEAAYAPAVKITTTDDNVVNLTAGELEVVIEYKAIDTRSFV